jgi:hypothetical protein
MAQVSKSTAAPVVKPEPATKGVFTLGEEESKYVASLSTRGPSKPPKYLDAIREAVSTGDHKGLQLVGDLDKEADKIIRAARQDLNRAAASLSREMGLTGGKVVKVSSKVVRNHPRLGSFLAWTATVANPSASDVASADESAGE